MQQYSPLIRPANISDAAALTVLAERTFRDAFSADTDVADIEHYCASHFHEDIQRKEISDANKLTLVVEHNGELIAYTQLSLHLPHDTVNAAQPMELKRIYVAQVWHGQGVAQKVMSALLELAEKQGADIIWLSVWEHNPRAIAFYQKYGFETVGEQIFEVGSDPQRDLIMARQLGA